MWRPSVAALTIAGLAGCSPGDPRPAVVMRDSAGVRIVENPAPPAGAPDVWRVGEAPVLQLGAVDGPPAYQFEYVAGAMRVDGGAILVADAGADELRAFSGSGEHLWSVGRDGEGPGEFRNIGWVRPFGPDSMAVFDRSLRRISVFTTTGTFARIARLRSPDGVRSPRAVDVLADGSILVAASQTVSLPAAPGLHRPRALVVRDDPTGTLRNTITEEFEAAWFYHEGTRMLSPLLFGPALAVGAFDDRIYVAFGDGYQIREYATEGDLRSLIRLARPKLPVAADDIRRWEEERFGPDATGSTSRRMRRSVADMPLPETFPVFSGLVVDRLGNLWVEHYRRPGEETIRYDVFGGDGVYRGVVTLPDGLTVMEIGDDYVLGRWADDMDLHYVRLYRLEKGGAGSEG